MQFLQNLIATTVYDTPPFSLVLFILSVVLLGMGIALMVHMRAMRLSFLENKPLNWIEVRHPHLPSPRVIVTIALCSTTLLLVGLQTMQNIFPFNDPYQGLNLTSFFFLGTAIGILGELKWKGARDYAFAVLVGTAMAFLLLVMQLSIPPRPLTEKIFLLALLFPSILLIGQTVDMRHRRDVLLTVLLTFSLWVLIYLVQ